MPVREWGTLPPIPSHGHGSVLLPLHGCGARLTSRRSILPKASLLASLSALDETAWRQTVKPNILKLTSSCLWLAP